MIERLPIDRVIAGVSTDVCICGHPRSEHYTYICNGEDAVRCRSCDPMVAVQRGNPDVHHWSLPPSDTHFTAMYHAADHEFELAE